MRDSSTLTIDLNVIERNIAHFAKTHTVCAMVKANAYGMGALALIPHLERFSVTYLGVSHTSEGIALREAGIEMPILVISAPPFEAEQIAQYNLEPAVSSLEEIEVLEKTQTPINVHLNINTGMNRFGVKPEAAHTLIDKIDAAPHLHLEGMMTHFLGADRPDLDATTEAQLKTFHETLKKKPRWIHAANGPAAVRFAHPCCNLVRIGLPLFTDALTLTSHLNFIGHAHPGETIGYNATTRVNKPTRYGVIPVGYYDGYHRHFNTGYVLIDGAKAPILGHICMDFMMVDLTTIPTAKVGDPVTLFDAQLSPETVASWGNTDVRELLVSIGPRTKREYTYEQTARVIEENPPPREHLLPS